MYYKYCFVGLGHFAFVAVVLKILLFIPGFVHWFYKYFAFIFVCVVVARLTFRFTKRKYLCGRIKTNNKAVLITGCDSGFGNGIAKRLDSLGFHVFASCLFPDGPGAKDLRKSCSEKTQVLGLDVSRDDSVQTALEFVKENIGKCELWAIVNNAGVQRGFYTEVSSIDDFKDCMNVNGFGQVRVTKAFLPLLKKSKGRVVNVSSLAGRMGMAEFSPYTMSKFASSGFSECLRREVCVWGVRVISVEPEAFRTNMGKEEYLSSIIDNLKEEFVSIYGENYLDRFRKFLNNIEHNASTKIYKVIDDLEKAVCLENPDVSYHPSRSVFVEEGINFNLMLPKVLQEMLLILLNFLLRWPRPTPQQ